MLHDFSSNFAHPVRFSLIHHAIGFYTSFSTQFGKESSTGFGGESGPGLEKDRTARNDDVKVETVLGRDLPTGNHDQFSTELSPPKARDDFDSKAEGTRDEANPSTYT
uniref:Low-temperature-induced 65 kDa protein n=1 Tax=Noccaea caerulescens TaxID=107243 RepID=A0A1J3E9B0_NOCCA